MLISKKSCLSESMEIPSTFSELKKRHLELHSACKEFRSHLRGMAKQLMTEYIQSLLLPADTWKDCKGKSRPYVDTGVWVSRDEHEFKSVPIPELDLDGSFVLNFVVITTLDDHPITGGFSHGVDVSLWYEGEKLYVLVGFGKNAATFYVSPQDNFHEVVAAIKLTLYLDMEDSRPGKALY
ncbi:hypothetical protein GTE46_005480 [Salmonella enterica subsp. enterica]|nr:hypothetical protein [Salmonella enterica subsp. enterica]EDY2803922.1 hypothetical protein [Salmonella enterica subsp. enterica]